MIRVRADMVDFEMEMSGHAQAPREGEHDLVCCAASIIAYQLLNSLEIWNAAHEGISRLERDIEPGHMRIRAKVKEWARAPVRERFSYWLEGVRMLEKEYPSYITVEEE